MDEKMKVLKMLEEGKISAEDAYELLKALENTEKGEKEEESEGGSLHGEIFKMVGETIKASLSGVPEIVKGSIEAGFSYSNNRERIDDIQVLEDTTKLVLSVSGADVNLERSEDKSLKVTGEGVYSFTKEKDTGNLSFSNGDVDIRLPQIERAKLKILGSDLLGKICCKILDLVVQGADVELEVEDAATVTMKNQGATSDINFTGKRPEKIMIEIQGSECRLSGISGKASIKGAAAELDLTLGEEIEKLDITMSASDIDIRLDESFNGVIYVKGRFLSVAGGGKYKFEEEGEYRKLRIGEGKSRVKIENNFGSVTVK